MDLKKALKSENLLSTIFIISAAVSLVAIVPEIANHVEFYKALENFQFTLNNVTMNTEKISQGEVYVKVTFNATNPTGFAGLKITSITCHLKYLKDHNVMDLTGLTEEFEPAVQVNPHQSNTLQMNFALTFVGLEHHTYLLQFLGYLESNPQSVDWIITGQYTVYLYTTPYTYQMDLLAYSTYLD